MEKKKKEIVLSLLQVFEKMLIKKKKTITNFYLPVKAELI